MFKRKHIFFSALLIAFVMFLTACNKQVPAEEAIVNIDGEKIIEAEVMLYLLQVKTQFEQVGGVDIWNTEDFSGGKTAEQVAKEGALDNLFKYKILVKKASSMAVDLEQAVIDQTTQIANDYFGTIPQDVIEAHGITKKIVVDSFLDFKLASEVEAAIKDNYVPTEEQVIAKMLQNLDYAAYKDYNTKEVLTLAKVKQIFTRTANLDENNEVAALSLDEQQAALDAINEAFKLAIKGENFDDLIEKYSENDQSQAIEEISVVELKKFFIDFSIGQISQIAETSSGYYIFQLMEIIEPTDDAIKDYEAKFKEWEDTLREDSIINLKQAAFDEIYGEWEKETPTEVNNELWDQISIF
ncbi:MAG: hypothetical protein H7X94_02545 [Vallitaleaceae bacterium]|nr:hypothetical protein [Vallitaleaceae bacterium]